MSTYTLTVDDTELQMIAEALRRTQPFTDLSPELAKTESDLEHKIKLLLERDELVASRLHEHDGYAPHSHEVRPDHLGVAR